MITYALNLIILIIQIFYFKKNMHKLSLHSFLQTLNDNLFNANQYIVVIKSYTRVCRSYLFHKCCIMG